MPAAGPRFDDRHVKGCVDRMIEPIAPLPPQRLYDLWVSLPEGERVAFVVATLDEAASRALLDYLVERHREAG